MKYYADENSNKESRSIANTVMQKQSDIRPRSMPAVTPLIVKQQVGKTEGEVTQMMKVYRVQDDDAEKKRVEVSEDGNVKVNAGPLNISIGMPDHALYFLAKKGYYDVVEFDIDDSFYESMVKVLQSQHASKKKEGLPTYNDASKPGYKIEIPKDGEWLDNFKISIKEGTGKVTQGQVFQEKNNPKAFNEEAVHAFVKQIFKVDDKVMTRRVIKELSKLGIEYEDEKLNYDKEMDIDWADLKEKLWIINNEYFDKQLRGVK